MHKDIIVPIISIVAALFMFPIALTVLMDLSFAVNWWALDGDFNYINSINEKTLRFSVAFTIGMVFVILLMFIVAFLESLNRQEREREI